MDGENKTTRAEISEEDFLAEIGRESAARAPGFAKLVAAARGTLPPLQGEIGRAAGMDSRRIIIPVDDVRYSDGDDEVMYIEEAVVAQLLMDEKVSLFEGEDSAGKKTLGLYLPCNDLFSWGCADGERLVRDDLPLLYEMHMADPAWGTDRWCILKRNQMPQKPVLDAMRTDGAWDLDASAIGPSADPGATAAQRRRVHDSFFHGKTPTTSA